MNKLLFSTINVMEYMLRPYAEDESFPRNIEETAIEEIWKLYKLYCGYFDEEAFDSSLFALTK